MIKNIPAIGKYGLVIDTPIGDAPIDSFTYCQNVRFRDGMAELMYGHGELSNGTALTGYEPNYCIYNGDSLDGYWLILGPDKAYASQNGSATWTDVTRVAGDYTGDSSDRWVGGVLNGIVGLTNNVDTPQVWTWPSAGTKCIDMSNWPSNTVCKSLRPFKNYWIALNITESSPTEYYPHRVFWSDAADPGSQPDWDVTDTTKDAGHYDISGGDWAVDGGEMGDRFIIYKERSTHVMTWIGGQYIFRFDQIFADSGILATNCWAEVNGTHVVLTATDVIQHSGTQGSGKSILDGKTRRWLFQNIDRDYVDLCFVVKQVYFNEVWICFPSQGATECDQALIWNYKTGVTYLRDLPDIRFAALGPSSDSVESTWNADTQTWDSDIAGWGSDEFTPGSQRVIMISPTTQQLLLADSTTRFDGTAIGAEITRQGITFGDSTKRKLIRSVRPRMEGGANSVSIQMGSSETLHGAVTWSDAKTYTTGSAFKVDFLVEGRYLAFKMTSTSDYWRLESLDIDVEPLGDY